MLPAKITGQEKLKRNNKSLEDVTGTGKHFYSVTNNLKVTDQARLLCKKLWKKLLPSIYRKAHHIALHIILEQSSYFISFVA